MMTTHPGRECSCSTHPADDKLAHDVTSRRFSSSWDLMVSSSCRPELIIFSYVIRRERDPNHCLTIDAVASSCSTSSSPFVVQANMKKRLVSQVKSQFQQLLGRSSSLNSCRTLDVYESFINTLWLRSRKFKVRS